MGKLRVRPLAVIASVAAILCEVGIASATDCSRLPTVTNLNLTFHTRKDNARNVSGHESTWTLDAVGSWTRPAGEWVSRFTGYAVKLSTSPVEHEVYSCAIDTSYTLTRNESITFPDANYGFKYVMKVRTYDRDSDQMQPSFLSARTEPSYSPDCYEETQSAAFCNGRDVHTTGKPVNLTIDYKRRQDDGSFKVQASWARPVQSNGVITFYAAAYRQPNLPKDSNTNGGAQLIQATKESGEWDPSVRYEYAMVITPNSYGEYELKVTPQVQIDGQEKDGYTAELKFNLTGVSATQGSIIRARDSVMPNARTTPPPRRPWLIPFDGEDTSETTSPSEETVPVVVDVSTSPAWEEDVLTPSTSSGSHLMKASVASGLALAFVLSMAAGIWLFFRRKKKDDELKKAVFIRTREEEMSMYHHKGTLEKKETDYKECLPEFEAKEVDRTLLKLEKELGSGQFGVVYKGFAFGIYNKEEYSPVAVKSLKCNASLSMKEDFLDEIKLIIEIGTHPNILSVLGCCTVDEPYYLITEFMKYGDLLHFLWMCREENRSDDGMVYVLTETNKIQVARQITRGMEYLSNTRYYHGDLAARNVLVGEDLVVKISDFGLADDIYQNGYKRLAPQRKRPVKWVSPETNSEGKCTIQSDVWSFGIVLYEIYTLGSMPYPGMDGREVIRRLQTGYRMENPSNCPEDIYDIMRQCWREKPFDRPTFTNLFNTFDKMLVAQCDYMPLEGVVYDHCILTSGSCGIKARGEEKEVSKALETTRNPTATNEEVLRNDGEQSDTTLLFQTDKT